MGPHLHKKITTFEDPDQEVVITLVPSCQCLHFSEGFLQTDLWELFLPLLHVVEGKVVGLEELEVVDSQGNNSSDLEVRVNQISSLHLVVVLLPLQELATPDARILVGILVHLDGIISAEEGNNELPVMLIFVLRNESGLEPHHVLIVGKDLGHVLLGGLWLQTVNTAQRVLRSAVPVEWWHLMFDGFSLWLVDLCAGEVYAQFELVVGLGEIISINHSALSSEDVDDLPDREVSWGIIFFPLQTHAWVNSVDGLLG